MVESDPNLMPNIDLFPRVTKVVHFLLDQLRHEGMSDHATSEVLVAGLEQPDEPN